MQMDPNNKIVKICAEGMAAEGKGENETAFTLFKQAWTEAGDDFEKFIAAHYVARHQTSVEDKLKWDETCLQLAKKLNDESVKTFYPSLYLNIGKCYEDLNEIENARTNYQLASSFAHYLPDDGYGKMIRSGIEAGIERVSI